MAPEWLAPGTAPTDRRDRSNSSAVVSTVPQRGADKQPPDQKPRIPEAGMPRQRAMVGGGRRVDAAGLDEQTRGGLHQPVDGQDHRGGPGQPPHRAIALRPGLSPQGHERQPGRDRLDDHRRPHREHDAKAAGTPPCLEGAADRVQEPRAAQSPIHADGGVHEPDDRGRRRECTCAGGQRHGPVRALTGARNPVGAGRRRGERGPGGGGRLSGSGHRHLSIR